MGVGVKGATEAITRRLQRELKADPGLCVLQVDMSDAFNSLDRTAMLQRVHVKSPALSAWAHFCYAQPSPLFVGESVLLSQRGSQQGDPLGPALFALAIQPVIEGLMGQEGLHWQCWFLDDGLLVGSEAALRRLLPLLATELSKLGLKVNLSKCAIWSLSHALETSPELPAMELSQPKVVLGIPFGSATAQRSFLLDMLARFRRLLKKLSRLSDSHVALCLLRVSLGVQRIAHLLRVLWSPLTDEFVSSADWDMRVAFESILGCGCPDAAWIQAGLPIRNGGLGLQQPMQVHAAAFVASCLAEAAGVCSVDGAEAPPQEEFWAAAARLATTLGSCRNPLPEWLAARKIPSAGVLVEGQCLKQQYWSGLWSTKVGEELLLTVGQRDTVRLLRQREPHAGAWLSAYPSEALGLHFGDEEFRLLLKFHLGLPVMHVEETGCACEDCGEPLDIFGDHAVSCRMAGAYSRHNQVASSLEAIAKAAGFVTHREVPVDGLERPADLEIVNWHEGKPAAVDPTVIHSLNVSQDWRSASALAVVEAAEEAKVQHYEASCERAGMQFHPVGMDLFGGFGPRASEFLKTLFSRYARHSARATELLNPGQLQKECWERVSVALHKAVGRQLVRFMGREWDGRAEGEGDGLPEGGEAGGPGVGPGWRFASVPGPQ
jgi:hypothetical protein